MGGRYAIDTIATGTSSSGPAVGVTPTGDADISTVVFNSFISSITGTLTNVIRI